MPGSTLSGLYPTVVAADEDGRRHVLRVLPGARGVPTPSDPYGRIPGPKRVVLEGGGEVERVSRGVYLTPWGERLVSDDPDAP
jgi:hypothetical protein